MIDLNEIQRKHRAWAFKNFGHTHNIETTTLGIVEEVGELAHALLKKKQSIRGTVEAHDAKLKDAAGDALLFLVSFIDLNGWNTEEIIKETFDTVQLRDWRKYPFNGIDK